MLTSFNENVTHIPISKVFPEVDWLAHDSGHLLEMSCALFNPDGTPRYPALKKVRVPDDFIFRRELYLTTTCFFYFL